MWFFTLLSWVASCCQVLILTLCVASGLYYLAELVEEYTMVTKKVITWLIYITLGIYVCLGLFETLPWTVLLGGALSQCLYLALLRTFPYFVFTSMSFIGAAVLLVVNHYLAFSYFSDVWHTFSEVLAFFTVCIWLVPFALFISLSANDLTLPTVEARPVLGDNDLVSNIFKGKGKKYGLLTGLQYAQENWLGIRGKKRF